MKSARILFMILLRTISKSTPMRLDSTLSTASGNHQVMKHQLHALARSGIARFVVREDRDAVFLVKNRFKSSTRNKEAYITQDFARAIQRERKTLIKAMFAAKKAGREAKVVNRILFIDNNVYDISSIPAEFQESTA